jgi:hypothetical protein
MSWTLEQPQPRKNPMLGKERKDPSIGVHIARAMLGWEKKAGISRLVQSHPCLVDKK